MRAQRALSQPSRNLNRTPRPHFRTKPSNGTTKINQPANPQTSSTSLPQDNDHCLNCNYSLKNLQTYRCPECGHLNSREELKNRRLSPDYSLKLALRCTFYPIVAFITIAFIVFLLLTVVGQMDRELAAFMFLTFFVAIPYSLFHLGLIIAGAARLTQAQIIKKKSPLAIFADPRKAIPRFLLHFSWMSFPPSIILFILLSWLANNVFTS